MPNLLYTVDNLVDEVRSQLDEQNRDSVDTNTDILPVLNRAQLYAFDILSRRYPEPILAYGDLQINANQQEYTLPENVFEDRILKLEMRLPSGAAATYREVERISYRDISNYESGSQTNIPYYYTVFGRTIRLTPLPSGAYSARMWYLRNPEKLVLPQGRITIVNEGLNYIDVDSAGGDLTTESDIYGSYVNFIDGQTGEIRGTMQIQNISNDRIYFRTSPTRASVLNRTINTDMADISPKQDDYICLISGICVPYYGTPISNFLIQFTVAEITRKLGGESDKEENILQKFEKQVERTWAGRETQLRIKKKSRIWGTPARRWWFFG